MFVNQCQIIPPTEVEQLTIDSFDSIEDSVSVFLSKAYQLDQYGLPKEADKYWDSYSDVTYLVQLLSLIRERIISDFQNCSLQSHDFYVKTYDLDCIKDHFSCLPTPFNVDDLFDLYGISNNTFNFDGIAYEALELDSTPICNKTEVLEIQ